MGDAMGAAVGSCPLRSARGEAQRPAASLPIVDIVGTGPHANYDVSPGGKTFVMVRRSPAARIVVIQNLPALVRWLRGERRD